jgi:hypothetical protein
MLSRHGGSGTHFGTGLNQPSSNFRCVCGNFPAVSLNAVRGNAVQGCGPVPARRPRSNQAAILIQQAFQSRYVAGNNGVDGPFEYRAERQVPLCIVSSPSRRPCLRDTASLVS